MKMNIKALIIDLDGVVWRSYEPIGNTAEIFNHIHDLGLKFVLATNNSTKTPSQYQERLAKIGLRIDPGQVITSSIAAAALLQKRFPSGGVVYIIGEDGLNDALVQAGFHIGEKNAVAVIAGLDRHISYEKLSRATLLIRSGVPFYGTNPDLTFPTPQGFTPGAGAILAALQAATGVDPIIAGKPHKAMIQTALSHLQVSADQALVVGDRLETDILAGQNTGCKTALVLSGASSRQQLETWHPKPDLVSENLEELVFSSLGK
jgi:4-nitrophenyl phosphatase